MTRSIAISLGLLAFAGQSATAGLFGEHKAIGDSAFARFLRTHNLIRFFRDTLDMDVGMRGGVHTLFSSQIGGSNFGITYGDITGLAGDHEMNPLDLMNDIRSRSTTLSRSLKANLKGVEANRKGASDLELTMIDLFYPVRAIIDKSHFYRLGESFTEQLSRLNARDLLALRGDFAALQEEEFRELLESGAVAKYAILHSMALDVMFLAGTLYTEGEPYSLHYAIDAFELGLLLNAFGDHFLQDAFSSGHLAVLRTGWTPLDDKGTHDYYSRIGLDVENRRGDRWKEYGDGFIETDAEGFAAAVGANVESLHELWESFREGGGEGNSFLDQLRNTPAVPEFILARFKAFDWMPIPVDPRRIRFGNSRNGTYLSMIVGRAFSSTFEEGRRNYVGGQVGLGLSLANAPKDEFGRESILWVSLNMSLLGGAGWHMLKGGMELILADWFSAGVQLGSLRLYGVSRFCFTPSAGVEFKPVSWSIAPSLRIDGTIVPRREPVYSVRIDVRYY